MGRMSASTCSRVVSMSQKGLAKEGITVSKKSKCLLPRQLIYFSAELYFILSVSEKS